MANCTGDKIVTGCYEKHICWICQEELRSEVLLLQHYENHVTSDSDFKFQFFLFMHYKRKLQYITKVELINSLSTKMFLSPVFITVGLNFKNAKFACEVFATFE